MNNNNSVTSSDRCWSAAEAQKMQLWQWDSKTLRNSSVRKDWCCRDAESNVADTKAEKSIISIFEAEACAEDSAERTDITDNAAADRWRQELAVHDVKMLEECQSDDYDDIVSDTDRWLDETNEEYQD